MVRFLCEWIDWLGNTAIAELDPENTDNLREVVVQYMHDNGMTFEILGEDKDEDGNDTITTKDEDGTVTTYFLMEKCPPARIGNICINEDTSEKYVEMKKIISNYNLEDRLDEAFFLQQISTRQDLEDICPYCDSREDIDDLCPYCSEDSFKCMD